MYIKFKISYIFISNKHVFSSFCYILISLFISGQLINLTVPFITQIKHAQHPGVLKELTDFSVSLYLNHLDKSLNRELPTPISNEVTTTATTITITSNITTKIL